MSTAELPLVVQSDSLEDWCACAALGIKVVTQPDFKKIGGALSHHVQTKPYPLTMAHTRELGLIPWIVMKKSGFSYQLWEICDI